MDMIKVSEYARALYSAHGNKAELEAAQRQKRYEAAGKREEAKTWLSVRAAIRQLKGPNQS